MDCSDADEPNHIMLVLAMLALTPQVQLRVISVGLEVNIMCIDYICKIHYSYIYNGGPIESRIMVYRTATFSVTLNNP